MLNLKTYAARVEQLVTLMVLGSVVMASRDRRGTGLKVFIIGGYFIWELVILLSYFVVGVDRVGEWGGGAESRLPDTTDMSIYTS